jgi:hypothetical protein
VFWFRTVFIITTRDERLVKSLSADHVFTMAEIDENQSLELHSWHVFGQPSPGEEFSELSKTVDAYCGKSLVVTYLRGQNKNGEVHYRS